MRLLIVSPEYLPTSGGGIVTFYRHLAPALVRQGLEVTVLVGSAVSQPGGAFESEGVRVVGLGAGRFQARLGEFTHLDAAPALARHLAAAWALHDEARRLGTFDRVEAVDWGLAFVPWIVEAGPPVLVRGHGSLGQIARREPVPGMAPAEALLQSLERLLLRRASAVATYATANAREWERLLGRPVYYLPPALPLSEPRATSAENWLLVLARVQVWKGPQVLAEALMLRPDGPVVRWVGRDVPDASGASTLARLREDRARIWSGRIEHHDTIPAARAQEWIRAARTVLVPSLWDVFNFAGAEAMAAGAIVCASAGAGMAELLEDGANGFVVPAGDAHALASALQRAGGLSPSERTAMGDAARATVAARLAPDAVATANLALLERLEPVAGDADPLDALLAPRGGPAPRDAHLGQYPLRGLLQHVLGRLRRKVVS